MAGFFLVALLLIYSATAASIGEFGLTEKKYTNSYVFTFAILLTNFCINLGENSVLSVRLYLY